MEANWKVLFLSLCIIVSISCDPSFWILVLVTNVTRLRNYLGKYNY